MISKLNLTNVVVKVVSNSDKENCAPHLTFPHNKKEIRKKVSEDSILQDITHKFKTQEVSGIPLKLR